jgi:hypothetical protein
VLHERPVGEQAPLPAGVFPVLVEPALFRRVQERLAGNQRQSVRPDRDPHIGVLRRGHVYCGYCHMRMAVKADRTSARYECSRVNRVRHGCPGCSISVAELDGAVWPLVAGALARPDVLALRLTEQRVDDPTAAALPAAETRLAALEKRRATLRRRLGDEDDDELAAEYGAELKTLVGDVRAAEAHRAALLAQRAAWQAGEDQAAGAVAYAEQVATEARAGGDADLHDLPWERRRGALHRLGARVRVWRPDEPHRWALTLAWRDPASAAESKPWRGTVDLDDGWGIDWAGCAVPVPEAAGYFTLNHGATAGGANVLPTPSGW